MKSYEKAIERLHQILENIQSPDRTINQLRKDIREAADLIKKCRKELRLTEEELHSLFSEEE